MTSNSIYFEIMGEIIDDIMDEEEDTPIIFESSKMSDGDVLFAHNYFGKTRLKGNSLGSWENSNKMTNKVLASNKLNNLDILRLGIKIISALEEKTKHEEILLKMYNDYGHCIINDFKKIVIDGTYPANPVSCMGKLIDMSRFFEQWGREKLMRDCIKTFKIQYSKFLGLREINKYIWSTELNAMLAEKKVHNINAFL